MIKKSNYRRRRRTFKKRTFAYKAARRMQNKALSYVKKKYTSVAPIELGAGVNVGYLTISHVGGVNTNAPVALTHTLADSNPDGMLTSDMQLY